MTPPFAKAVDPIFLDVLDLLSRIQAQKAGDPAREKQRIRNRIDQAEDQLGARNAEWALAKYALVAWIDDVLYQAPWTDRTDNNWWNLNTLEIDFFKTRIAGTEFFQKAEEAGASSVRDALEVYYICVMLGFKGFYSDPNLVAQQELHNASVPKSLDHWARRVAGGLRIGNLPPILDDPREGAGTPALRGKFHVIGALFTLVTLLVITALVVFENSKLVGDFFAQSGDSEPAAVK